LAKEAIEDAERGEAFDTAEEWISALDGAEDLNPQQKKVLEELKRKINLINGSVASEAYKEIARKQLASTISKDTEKLGDKLDELKKKEKDEEGKAAGAEDDPSGAKGDDSRLWKTDKDGKRVRKTEKELYEEELEEEKKREARIKRSIKARAERYFDELPESMPREEAVRRLRILQDRSKGRLDGVEVERYLTGGEGGEISAGNFKQAVEELIRTEMESERQEEKKKGQKINEVAGVVGYRFENAPGTEAAIYDWMTNNDAHLFAEANGYIRGMQGEDGRVIYYKANGAGGQGGNREKGGSEKRETRIVNGEEMNIDQLAAMIARLTEQMKTMMDKIEAMEAEKAKGARAEEAKDFSENNRRLTDAIGKLTVERGIGGIIRPNKYNKDIQKIKAAIDTGESLEKLGLSAEAKKKLGIR
jgi:hypothetical protein